MSTRELTAISLRTLAVWLFASGLAGLSSALFTWGPDVAQYGEEMTSWRLASASIFVPIGALLWLISDEAARWAFPDSSSRELSTSLTRADLYAFASVLVGMFLLSDALTQVVYWIVVWRSARGTSFWESSAQWTSSNGVVYWVHLSAQVGLVLAKTVLGVGLLFGPERLKAGVRRLRREFSSTLPDAESAASDKPTDRL